jgi:Amt family ammonium transporter
MNAAPQSDLLLALTFALIILAPLSFSGLALVNVGLSRSRSAAQALLGSMLIVAVAAIAFVVVGSVFAGSARILGFHAGGKIWPFLGFGPWMLRAAAPATQLRMLFECLAAAFVAIIPWGAGADRFRLAAGCACAILLGIFVFPLISYWTWGEGWLAQLGVSFGMGAGFLDPGGAAGIHALGGFAALAVIWIAGPRKGKFPREGLATAMPAHNAVLVLFGCLVALVGWLAWNAAGALLFIAAPISALPQIALNTLLAAAGALLATFIVTRIRFGKADASLCANGWLAGLVTSSACAAVVSPGAALFTGVVAGIATPLLVEVLELALSIDDPTGAVSAHAVAGLWGLFAAGLFSTQRAQTLAQLVGISALLGFCLPLTYFLFAGINRFVPFRVDPDGERLGMDLHELGGGAYPEFVLHRDESYR